MKYPRVNLIKKNEQRYQGIVSRNFILLIGIGTPLIIIALIAVTLLMQHLSVQSQLASSKAVWETFEPRIKAFRKEKAGLITTGKIMGLFEGWEQSQTSIVDLMDDVQVCVPSNVQFSRMSILSGKKSTIFKNADELKLHYSLTIDGVAVGEQAESQVLLLQRQLQASHPVSSVFDSLKLASMRNKLRSDNTAMSEFRLIATAGEGVTK
ncbi:hypothetical protein [Pontiella agarivorans]|uniref:Transmembrane protein n=1 Tax=Pontiella agarivorans TaxID=3038953 RepID=A0ABU5MYW8_9BACT|nr:hypothetical protein [Pontiella agarivorans]MDZ8119389.1 hypothetical protein [Pontiella agarivorans]